MRANALVLHILCPFLVLLTFSGVQAQWVEDGAPLCDVENDQYMPNPIADGNGGAFVVWEDYRPTNGIFIQRIDAYGNILWAADGNRISIYGGYYPKGVLDGAGGVIVTWSDSRYGDSDVFAQRVDGNGNPLWLANGVPICVATNSQGGINIVSDGNGGAILSWADSRFGFGDRRVYAQRIDSSGNVQWALNGVLVSDAVGEEDEHAMALDDIGYAIIVWKDRRVGSSGDIYAQKISPDGTLHWTSSGKAICTDAANQGNPGVISDGNGGVIFAWQDYRGLNYDIYAQRVGFYGNAFWPTDGIPICEEPLNQTEPVMVFDGNNGATIAWLDARNGDTDIYAQRVTGGGALLWASEGVPVCTTAVELYWLKYTSDGAGGIILVWEDDRNDPYYNGSDVYAQRINSSGIISWGAEGFPVTRADGEQSHEWVTTDGDGGAIICWDDMRPGTDAQDSYMQRVTKDGYWGYPCPFVTEVTDVPKDQGGLVTVTWDPSSHDEAPYEDVTYYSIWRSLAEPVAPGFLHNDIRMVTADEVGADFEGPACRIEVLGGATYAWEWIGNIAAHRLENYSFAASTLYDSMGTDPGYHCFFVSAHTSDPFIYWDSPPDSGYSVDNFAPGMPLGLAGEQLFTPEGLQLTWDPNSESDLAGYNIYRDTESGFIPGPGNFLTSTPDTATVDSGWSWAAGFWYKVAAVDIHGNESLYAVFGPDMVTGDDPMPLPDATFLAQNFPNPFNPITNIRFGLKEQGHMSLRIYDAAGRLIITLIDESRPAGNYNAEWNGRDKNGSIVASGVYFYRLSAEEFVQTKKMVLLR